MLFEGSGKGGPTFHILPDLADDIFEELMLLLGREDVQRLDQRQSGIDHRCQLTGEDGDTALVHLFAKRQGNLELFSFGCDFGGDDALLPEMDADGRFTWSFHLALLRRSLQCLSFPFIDWHNSPVQTDLACFGLSFSLPTKMPELDNIWRNSSILWLRSMASSTEMK